MDGRSRKEEERKGRCAGLLTILSRRIELCQAHPATITALKLLIPTPDPCVFNTIRALLKANANILGRVGGREAVFDLRSSRRRTWKTKESKAREGGRREDNEVYLGGRDAGGL